MLHSRDINVSFDSDSHAVRVDRGDTLHSVASHALHLMQRELPNLDQLVVTIGSGLVDMVGYTNPGSTDKWHKKLLCNLRTTDNLIELQLQSDIPSFITGADLTSASGTGLDWASHEQLRLENCLNLYQVLKVGVEASSADILAALQRSMNVLRTSGTAVEHLAIHYSCAHDVLGNEDLRMLYDGACRPGYSDCSKLFTDTESRLTVSSFDSADMYRQLTKIWKAKECHAVKLLVTDVGSPANTIAAVMAKLLSCLSLG